jgi:hypothetical protein
VWMSSPLTSANLTQVHTDNQPSMLLSWWFRPVNTEAPQLRRHTRAAEKAALVHSLVSSDGSDKEDATPPAAPPAPHAPGPLQRDCTAYLQSALAGYCSHSDACEDDDEPGRTSPADSECDCDNEDSDTHIITPSHSCSQIPARPVSPSFSHGAQRPGSTSGVMQKAASAAASTSRTLLTPQASECPPHDPRVATADTLPRVPPADYWAFYPHLSQPFDVADFKWANSGHRPKTFLAGRALDLVPEHKRREVESLGRIQP